MSFGHAVVLCLNEDGTRQRFRERLYVGLSRATDRLVVVGEPDLIERACGRDVRERGCCARAQGTHRGPPRSS